MTEETKNKLYKATLGIQIKPTGAKVLITIEAHEPECTMAENKIAEEPLFKILRRRKRLECECNKTKCDFPI